MATINLVQLDGYRLTLPSGRVAAVGEDRDGTLVWAMTCGNLVAFAVQEGHAEVVELLDGMDGWE